MIVVLFFSLGYILELGLLSVWIGIFITEMVRDSRLYLLPFLAGQLLHRSTLLKKEVNEWIALPLVLLGIYLRLPLIYLPLDWPLALVVIVGVVEILCSNNLVIQVAVPLILGLFIVTYAEKFKYLFFP